MTWIVLPTDDWTHAPIGGKATALAQLTATGFPVPPWFVVTPEAFFACLGTSAASFAALTNPGDIQRAVAHVEMSPEVATAIWAAVERLGGGHGGVAVRSSASDEDGSDFSFAGQLESFLFVPPALVLDRVVDVWRSACSERVLMYRRTHALPVAPRPPGVLVQQMVDAEAAGVAFSADPVSGSRTTRVVAAVYGLGTALVSGEANADTWHVDRTQRIVKTAIAEKTSAHYRQADLPAGIGAVPVPSARQCQPALSEAQVLAVAQLTERAAVCFERPQDIEWALHDGTLYVLQSRPITALTQLPDPQAERVIWDNSNIAESYGGITTPLTFSFARRAS